MIEPPDKLPSAQRGDRTQRPRFPVRRPEGRARPRAAKAVEERIWALWIVSRSDTADLLMTRVKTAVEGKNIDLAVKLLDAIVELRPDYIEAWNRRATMYFMQKEYSRSIEDIRQILAREPRHFGALSGLGLIMQEFGEEKRALEVVSAGDSPVHPAPAAHSRPRSSR